MGKTPIQWCDFSVNPIRARMNGRVGHHCVKVSPGCTNCYASTMQRRFGLPPFEVGKRQDVEVFFDIKKCQDVLRRKKPTKWFWEDMSDLFGEWVPFGWLDLCFATMALTRWHTHQVLTKRADRMLEYVAALVADPLRLLPAIELLAPTRVDAALFPPFRNIWLGVSAEDQERVDERIPLLLQTPAAVRFVSAEPLLGPMDLAHYLRASWNGLLSRLGLDWIIVGGESGPKARPCDVAWIRSIVRQCRAASVPVFVKQLGSRPVTDHRTRPAGEPLYWTQALRDRKGGDPSEWPEYLRVREFPA